MNSLEYGDAISDVGARSHPEAADQPGDFIGQYVAEEICRHDDIELPGIQNQLHRAGIDDAVFHLDAAFVGASNLTSRLEKNSRQRFQNICLVYDGDLAASMLHRVFEGEFCNASTTLASVHAGTDGDGMMIAADVLLDRNPDPSEDEIRDGLSGNLCRCTGYRRIFEAVLQAAR